MREAGVKFSWPVRLLIWAAVVGIFLLVGLMVWQRMSEGHAYKLVVPAIMSAFIGWHGYTKAKKTRIVRRSPS